MRWVLILLAGLAVTGCSGNCKKLAEKLCDCTATSVEKDSCKRLVAASESSNPPTPQDELSCGDLLKPPDGGPGCDCRQIDTPEGKYRCGLARGH